MGFFGLVVLFERLKKAHMSSVLGGPKPPWTSSLNFACGGVPSALLDALSRNRPIALPRRYWEGGDFAWCLLCFALVVLSHPTCPGPARGTVLGGF
jgi:hypothetical protein